MTDNSPQDVTFSIYPIGTKVWVTELQQTTAPKLCANCERVDTRTGLWEDVPVQRKVVGWRIESVLGLRYVLDHVGSGRSAELVFSTAAACQESIDALAGRA